MPENFVDMLAADGHKNSLGRVNDVIAIVLFDPTRLEELYNSIHHEDAWVRMRAIDAFEKICRQHPGWIEPYIDRIQKELSTSEQPSIQWHIAEIYSQVELNDHQKHLALQWLTKLLCSADVDWIVASDSMKTLAYFTAKGDISRSKFRKLLEVQLNHTSKAVVKRAHKLLAEFS